MLFYQILLVLLYLFAFTTFVLAFLFVYRSVVGRGSITRSLNMSIFLVSVPKEAPKQEDGEEKKEEKKAIGIMEQLYSSFSYIKEKHFIRRILYGEPSLSLEIVSPSQKEEIHFYVGAPRSYEDVIEKQIHSLFPKAQVERVEDYDIFHAAGFHKIGYLKLVKNHMFPFKTYQQLEADPLSELTTALSKIEENEGAAIQIILKPAKSGWRSVGQRIAKTMKQGKTFEQARKEASAFSFITQLSNMGTLLKGADDTKLVGSENQGPKQLTPLEEETVKALEGKAGKVGFYVNVRLLATAQTQERTDEIFNHLESAFTQFTSPDLNKIRIVVPRFGRNLASKRTLVFHFIFRLLSKKERMILNTEELTSLYHFPIHTTETPQIKWLKAKPAPAPMNMSKEGVILGKNTYRGIETVVKMDQDARRRHLYIIGQTGTGKSSIMKNMMEQDIKEGKGLCVIDPHGELIEHVIKYIPKERVDDVILFDPSDTERPLALNMLEYDQNIPEQKTFVVNEMIAIFDKLYDLKATGGPMFEQYMRNAMLLVMDDPESGSTLLEIPRVLADNDFRNYKLSKCKSELVVHFWRKEAEKAGGEASLANMVPYITSKLGVFLSNDIMRPIIAQEHSAFNFREIMDNKKILFLNLAKGKLGDINSNLLGMIVVGKLLMAALGRVDIPDSQRNDFYLYIDEFQNVTTNSIATILSEARKYRLDLIIAHQFIGQLEEKIRDAVFGNVGSMACFRVGATDAEFLVKQFAPVFSEQDLIAIDNYNSYMKLLVAGQTTKPFNIATYLPSEGDIKIVAAIKELSRLKYGRDRAVIEQEISKKYKDAGPELDLSNEGSIR